VLYWNHTLRRKRGSFRLARWPNYPLCLLLKKSVFMPCGPLPSLTRRTAHSSQHRTVTCSPTSHQRSRVLPSPPRCSDPALRRPPRSPVTPPCSPAPRTTEDRRLLELRIGAEDRWLPFFRDLSVTSLNLIWAPSSPLLAPSHCLRWTHADEPPFPQVARKCYAESVCSKYMFEVFQTF
jgi:hypothetical protein